MNLRTFWRIITKKKTPLEKARRAIRGARKHSRWLGERPFSDKNGYGDDYNDSRYGSPQ